VETPRPWPVSSAPQPASTKKWACAHSSVRPLQSEIRVYSRATAKARYRPPWCPTALRRGIVEAHADHGHRTSNRQTQRRRWMDLIDFEVVPVAPSGEFWFSQGSRQCI
jgi:hypothetical protein